MKEKVLRKVKNYSNKNGITLIALIITVIVLLIFSVVAITLSFNENGIIKQAREIKVEGQVEKLQGKIASWKSRSQTLVIDNKPGESLDSFLDRLVLEELLTSTQKEEIKNDPTNKITIDGTELDFSPIELLPTTPVKPEKQSPSTDISLINIGDVIYYDPTIGVTDTSKLTYTSIKGSSKAAGNTTNVSGNGYGTQTFKATNQDTKWVVLYKKDGQLILISENTKGTTANTDFNIYGQTAYIYMEQEVHNICSIYGHANGAASQQMYLTQPKIGSPDITGDLQNAIILQSGARSLMMEDIEEVTGIKTKEEKNEAARFTYEKMGQITFYNNNVKDYFMNSSKPWPETTVKIPTLARNWCK